MRKLFVLMMMVLLIFADPVVAQNGPAVEPPPPQEWLEGEAGFGPRRQNGMVEVRKLPAEKVTELKNDDDYWYANLEPKKKENELRQQPEESGGGGLSSFLWFVIIGVFAGAVIWYLASSNISLFRRESRKIMDESVEEETTDDIFAINYEKEISRAEAAGNYRSAIRFWYLRTLKELADRNIINYQYGKTNNDYVNSLYGSRYYQTFFRLTRNFEYTWYGQFPLSAEAYRMMQTDFSTFKAGLQ